MSSAALRTLPPLDRSRVADRIFHDLRDQIVGGVLDRGSRLPTERELAGRYGVSPTTVREAIRGLSVVGLIDVRHGSGAYVSGNGESLVAMSLGAVIQLQGVGIAKPLELLGVLNVHAGAAAVEHGTEADLRRLREAAEPLAEVKSIDGAVAGVRAYNAALVHAAHNPLLEVICAFLTDVQLEFALEVSEGSVRTWAKIMGGLQPDRMRLVEAIERRDLDATQELARVFNENARRLITSQPKAREVRLTDPQLGALLSSIVARLSKRA